VKPRLGSRRFVPGPRIWGGRGARPPGQQPRGQPRARSRGSADLQRVLADRFGCRSRRTAPGPRGDAAGLALRHRWGNLGSTGANGLRKPARGGKAVRTVAGSRKRAFVDGRRSGPRNPLALTRRRRNRVWLRVDPGSRFASAREKRGATEGARGRVTSSARGRKHRGRAASFGGAVDRSTRQDRTTPPPREAPGLTATSRAARVGIATEAGGSPSSEAPPGLSSSGHTARRLQQLAKPQGRARGKLGNRIIRRGARSAKVGCRSRREASFPEPFGRAARRDRWWKG